MQRAAMRKVAAAAARRAGSEAAALKKTPLYDFHEAEGCKFTNFAGYAMPVTYTKGGVMKEHAACREGAALFDVSHMGQWVVAGRDAEAFVEHLTPVDLQALSPGTGSLSVITNERGGIVDDTIIVRHDDHLHVVVNAGCQEKDYAHAVQLLGGRDASIERLDRSLLALQGPKAAAALAAVSDVDVATMPFMAQRLAKVCGAEARVTRCGYTGEDGFEISVPNGVAADVCAALQAQGVALAGLAARDSLRLEAGLCLYGNDMDEEVTPVEASLAWVISKRRRQEGGFVGAERVLRHLAAKPKEEGAFTHKRVCLNVTGPPARQGALLRNAAGEEVGRVTSGTYSPTLKRNIAMGYVRRNLQKAGTEVFTDVRGKLHPAEVVKAPFVPHNYVRI